MIFLLYFKGTQILIEKEVENSSRGDIRNGFSTIGVMESSSKKLGTLKKSTVKMKMKNSSYKSVPNEIICGKNVIISYNTYGIYVWGNMGKNFIEKPLSINHLKSSELKGSAILNDQIFVLFGLVNLPGLKFSNFNPPVIESGVFRSLFERAVEYIGKKFLIFFFIYLFF